MNGDIKPIQFMARREDYQDGISLHARKVVEGVSVQAACPIIYTPHVKHIPIEPFMFLSVHEAQQLMDELWQCGLRPTEGTGSAGSLAATQHHLDDFRKILFNKLKIGD